MSARPLCFVLMPFGLKNDPVRGFKIDFDEIYADGIRAAIEDAGMEPIRADLEISAAIIHKAMYERLLLCDFALADLTTANPNVFYELGVRHAARPRTTVTVFASHQTMPFDVNLLRSLPYDLAPDNSFGPDEAGKLRTALGGRLRKLRIEARDRAPIDSPIFKLLEGYTQPDIARLKTDTFRDQVEYSMKVKADLAAARKQGDREGLGRIRESIGDLDQVEVGVLVDLFLSHRAMKDWKGMICLYDEFPVELKGTIMLREQLGFALNRDTNRERALEVLEEVEAEQGPSSETCGLIGRVHKDCWTKASEDGREEEAATYLKKAIDAYVRGFEADWRDAYPCINASTLLDIRGDADSLRKKERIMPVVRYAVDQRLKHKKPDYWDQATLLELDVLDNDKEAVLETLGEALVAVREPWEPETTANNLKLIRKARGQRGVAVDWLDTLIRRLMEKAGVRD